MLHLKQFPSRSMDMLHGSLWDKILFFSLQLALTSTLQQMYNTADVIMLGRFMGDDAIAAVGNNLAVIGIMVNLFVGLSLGANVVTARYIGQGDLQNANRSLYSALNLGLVFGFLVAIPVIVVSDAITSALDVPPQVFNYSKSYLTWYMAGMPFLALFNFEAAIFRAIGDTSTPLKALFISSILNAALDYIFLSFDMGISGVAVATSMANFFSALYLFIKLLNSRGVLKLDIRKLYIFELRKVRAIVCIGLPAGIQGMVFSLSNLVIQGAINSLGAEVMAASSAALVYELNIYVFIMAFGMATTTFVSQNYGAGNLKRCSESVRTAMCLNFLVTILLSLIMAVYGRDLLGLLTADKQVVDLAWTRVYSIILLYFICVPFEVFSGAMRGFGYSLPPALATTVTIVGTRMIWLVTVFKHYPDFASLLITYPVSWLMASPFIFWLYMRCTRQLRRG